MSRERTSTVYGVRASNTEDEGGNDTFYAAEDGSDVQRSIVLSLPRVNDERDMDVLRGCEPPELLQGAVLNVEFIAHSTILTPSLAAAPSMLAELCIRM